jgi:hypothetical protein
VARRPDAYCHRLWPGDARGAGAERQFRRRRHRKPEEPSDPDPGQPVVLVPADLRLTVGGFANRGSVDGLAYGSGDAISGSATGQPNTNGWLAEVAWTPFGKRDSWGGTFANLKLGLQYVGYNRFNGGVRNYDGAGRNAADNNTLYAFLWLAF